MQLQSGTLLQEGKYRIEKVLGQGGFGITYLATQELLDRKVCIKEFFFKEYCNRVNSKEITYNTIGCKEIVERFLNKFQKEARTISRLAHPNIISIFDIFQENGTTYYVMEYIEGSSLADIVKQQGALQEHIAIDYVKQIGGALEYIHERRINHLDVKPANIMIRRIDDKAILIDFGISKQYDMQGGQTSTTPIGISHGYAPMEQYMADGVKNFSPQTDIYSLGATLYNLLTATLPPAPHQILDEGINIPSRISLPLADAIRQAMQQSKNKRPASIQAFVVLLKKNKGLLKSEEIKPVQILTEETKVIEQPYNTTETEDELRQRAYNIKRGFVKATLKWVLYICIATVFIPLFLGFICNIPEIGILSFFNAIICCIYMVFGTRHYVKKKSEEWKKQHPNDPVCRYIKTDNFWNIEYN